MTQEYDRTLSTADERARIDDPRLAEAQAEAAAARAEADAARQTLWTQEAEAKFYGFVQKKLETRGPDFVKSAEGQRYQQIFNEEAKGWNGDPGLLYAAIERVERRFDRERPVKSHLAMGAEESQKVHDEYKQKEQRAERRAREGSEQKALAHTKKAARTDRDEPINWIGLDDATFRSLAARVRR